MAKRRIELPDKVIEGTVVPFSITRDSVITLELDDGAVLNVKPVVLEVVRTEEKTPDGERLYLVMSTTQITVAKPARGDE